MKTCVVIPTHNESLGVGNLVNRLKQKQLDIVVIDDGSSDDTGRIAKQSGAIVISNEKQMGKGASIRKGFDFCLKNNYEGIITLDGDGQHDPDDISRFIDLAKEKNVDLIIGNRMINPRGMPWVRWLTNKFMSFIISSICKQKIPDSQCGYRFLRANCLKRVELTSRSFEIESELLIKASKTHSRIESVPIKTIYQNQKSKINPIIDTLRFLRFIIKELWISNF